MTSEFRIDKITAGRALCHVQTARTMMQFIIFIECKRAKWTQMKVARQFLSRRKVSIYSKSSELLRRWKEGRTNEQTRPTHCSLTLSTAFTNKPYTVTFRENNTKLKQ